MSEASRTMRYARALGWGAFAAAPVLLATLAVLASRPSAPAGITTAAAIAAWIAGALALGASLVQRKNRRAARIAGACAGAIVAAFCAYLAWAASELQVAALDRRERADLALHEGQLSHPHLGFALPELSSMRAAPEIEREARRAGGDAWARAHRVWAWRAGDAEIIVDLSRARGASADALAEATDRVAAELGGANVQRHRAGTRANRLEADLDGGGSMLVLVGLFEHERRAYRLIANVTAPEPIVWREWLAGIELPPR